jgi:hypothetical protein
VSPTQAKELQDFVLSRLTPVFPEAEISVTATPGGAVVKAKLEADEDEFEIKDYELETFRLRAVIL